MKPFLLHKIKIPLQYILSISLIIAVSAVSYAFDPYIHYRTVGFILFFTLSLIAMFFNLLPVLTATVLSAFIWDFFFIPPHFTLHVGTQEDTVLLIMYFAVALLNGVLTYKIRQFELIAMQKEEKANTVKLYNTLLNSLSHELKTPIATIIGAADNLEIHNSKLTPDNKKQLIYEISKASLRLNEQVENLLNMSRIESGFIQPKKDWVDITETVYSCIHRLEENINSHKIKVNINPYIPYFKLDKAMLEQIIYNLINNACLYTPPKSTIDIIAACHVDVLEIIIEDNGPGFPAEEIKFVFDKFYRLKKTKPGGTGLGLSIAKGFTEAMGGNIDLRNISTGGARFTINIPTETSYIKNIKNE